MSYDGGYGAPSHEKLFWETSQNIQTSPMQIDRLTREIATMAAQVEYSRQQYNDVLAERDQLKEQAKVAEQRLTEVQRVVARYAVVEDPVVASDGFTYERRVIKQYLEDCHASKSDAISQQTKEVLDSSLVSNHSLRKLVDLVKDVRPDMVPELSERRPIAPLGSSSGRPSNVGAEKNRSNAQDGDSAMLASDLEATWAHAAGGKGGRGDRREPREDRRDDRREDRREREDRRDGGNNSNRNHPCIRVYGFCNFKDECTFAKYPYDACLNNIKGKCRFGNSCKELHVNPNEKKYQNPKANPESDPASKGPKKADKEHSRDDRDDKRGGGKKGGKK